MGFLDKYCAFCVFIVFCVFNCFCMCNQFNRKKKLSVTRIEEPHFCYHDFLNKVEM